MGGGGGGYTGGITGAEQLQDLARKRLANIEGSGKTFNVFIPHAWDYEDEYQRLLGLLRNAEGVDVKDYSVPQADPLDAHTANELEQAIRRQMAPVSVVVVPAGMYVNHRVWIQREIAIAKELKKPIVAVKPRGSERMPQLVADCATEVAGWNKESIVDAIRKACADK